MRTDKILEMRRDWICFNVTDKNGNDHHKVRLPFRKTDLLDENGHVYDVYPCPLEPARCMYSALTRMRTVFSQVMGRDYNMDELIFPKVVNGKVHPNVLMTHALFASLLDGLVDQAGIL